MHPSYSTYSYDPITTISRLDSVVKREGEDGGRVSLLARPTTMATEQQLEEEEYEEEESEEEEGKGRCGLREVWQCVPTILILLAGLAFCIFIVPYMFQVRSLSLPQLFP